MDIQPPEPREGIRFYSVRFDNVWERGLFEDGLEKTSGFASRFKRAQLDTLPAGPNNFPQTMRFSAEHLGAVALHVRDLIAGANTTVLQAMPEFSTAQEQLAPFGPTD
jgi:hypothetical protein